MSGIEIAVIVISALTTVIGIIAGVILKTKCHSKCCDIIPASESFTHSKTFSTSLDTSKTI